MEKNIYKIEKELFITSDEEIQEGDYGFDEVHKCVVKITKELINNYLYKKIILTTDQELIKNGVQAIDDEFLEWFVSKANDSGKPIDIVEVESLNIGDGKLGYIICKPQEEPKQETIEEAAKFAEKKYLERIDNFQKCDFKDGVIEGAKWQQEGMYSEEEVLKLLQKARYSNFNSLATEDWFKRFRKNKIT